MPITVPTTYDDISKDELAAYLSAAGGATILDRLLDNANWWYGDYSPPVIDATPIHPTNQMTSHFISPITPSADGLSYVIHIEAWTSTAASNTTVDVYASTTTSTPAGWGAAIATVTVAHAGVAQAAGSATVVIGATVKFLKFESSSAIANQIQHILVYPAQVTSIATGALSSGFIGYDPGLLGATGGPVNTEHFNRAWKNWRYVLRDRVRVLQCVLFPDNYADLRPSPSPSIAKQQQLWELPIHLPAGSGETVTVRARASSGGGTHKLLVTCGYDGVALDCDNTDQSATMVLGSPSSQSQGADTFDVAVSIEWTGTVDCRIRYLTIEHDYSLSASAILTDPTPPAKWEYLAAMNEEQRRWVTRGYPWPANLIDTTRMGGTEWYLRKRIAGFMFSARLGIMRAVSYGTDTAGTDAEIFTTSSGVGGSDEILIGSPWSAGADVFPLANGQDLIAFKWGSDNVDTTPAAASDRRAELTAYRNSFGANSNERIWVRRLHGLVGRPYAVADLGSV